MKPEPQFVCEFCKKPFVQEARFLKHLCEAKRRWVHRDDKAEKQAFVIYHHVMVRYGKMARKPPTQDSFMRSPLYKAFLQFSRHVLDLEVIGPLSYVDFLMRIELPIDRWTNPEVYARYIRELSKNEAPLDALERNFLLMEQWAIATGEDWRDFFRKIAPPQAIMWIVNGRISPWLLFTASSAFDLLQRFNAEQKSLFKRTIDENYWHSRIARRQDEVNDIRAILAEQGI